MNTSQFRKNKIAVAIIVISILLSIGMSTAIFAEEPIGDCEKGLLRCSVGCLWAFFGGAGVGMACEAWCLWGYAWCLSYYE